MALTDLKKPEVKKPDLDTPEVDPTLGRRRFLRWGIYAIGAGVAGVLAVPVVTTFINPAVRPKRAEVKAQVGEQAAAQLGITTDKFQPLTVQPVLYTDVFKQMTLDGKDVFVKAKTENPTTAADYLILDATCTHAGCTVQYDDAKDQFTCPCHNAVYDKTGKNVAVAPKPLGVYNVKLEEGRLFIDAFQTFE
jgi:menaquinol-cytochrome c reductase iron-sulfur subunit